MGISTGKHVDARHRDEPDCRPDRGKAQTRLCRGQPRRVSARLIAPLFAVLLACASAAGAETLRIATYNVELQRDGPGLLLRDIMEGEDEQLIALRRVIADVSTDILLLQNVDYDHGLVTLTALRDWLGDEGAVYEHIFAAAPNTGVETGHDMDGDGRLGEPEDAQGYGEFFGQHGMALLSRHPILAEEVQDFTPFLWQDLPDALLPEQDGTPFPSAEALAIQRLASVAHWAVPVDVAGRRLTLLAFHAAPPVFDGPEDFNGRRNHDELIFWQHYLDGTFGLAPERDFVLLGDANLDPADGEGRREAIRALLNDPRLQDPRPMRPDGAMTDSPGQAGDPRLDTVAWPTPDPGHKRVDYVLPWAGFRVTGAGVYWPAPDDPMAGTVATASRHRLVWVDIELD